MISYNNYKKIGWVARLMTLGASILSVIYSLSLVLVATHRLLSVPVGSFQGGTIILFPLLIAVALIGWKWPLFGGILVLIVGIPIIFPILSATGWPYWYKIPYLTFWGIYLAGGILYLINAYLRKIQVQYTIHQ